MYPYVFIMIALCRARLAANVASVRSDPTMNTHVIFEIIRSVEVFAAHVATESLSLFVLPDVPLAIVFPDKLGPAMVAGVRFDGLVRVHVGGVVGLADESPAAHVALERFVCPGRVRPFVQFQVPLGRKVFVANEAGERPVSAVIANVNLQRGPEVHPLTNRTLDILRTPVFLRDEPFVVSPSHVTSQTGRVNELLAALRARLRFVVVNLFMPGEFFFRVKHFSARTDVVLRFLLNVVMVAISMLHKIRVTPERFFAQIAFNRCFASVYIFMFVEFLFS